MISRLKLALAAACIMASVAATAVAQEMAVELDAAQSRVEFVLGGTGHNVHGGFHLKNGKVLFDSKNGTASGQLAVDAATGESGNTRRDRKMHQNVLESAKFPEILFVPQRVIGKVALAGTSQIEIAGMLTMHGQTHAMTASGPVQINGDQVAADLRFVVPYEQWGIKNPSALFLRVSDNVQVTVHAVGRLAAADTSAAVSY